MNTNDKNQVSQDLIPWDEPVNGNDLIEELKTAITSFIIIPPEEALTVTYWILHTHMIKDPHEPQVFSVSPILNISSPEKQCGKSTLREIIAEWVKAPLTVMNATQASIFRVIESSRPTLLIDEADTFLQGKNELIGILNSGYKQDGHVLRQAGKTYEETKQFSTWSAKCIAGIGRLSDTIESRCLIIKLKRKKTSEKVQRRNSLLKNDPTYFTDYKRKIMRFVQDNEISIINQEVDMPMELNDRQQDNWEGIFKIAKFLGNDELKLVTSASIFLCQQKIEPLSISIQLLGDIKSIMESSVTNSFTSQDLVAELKKMEDRPWLDLNRTGINPNSLAQLLNDFEIRPKQIRFDHKNLRGYEKSDFEDAFSRYL